MIGAARRSLAREVIALTLSAVVFLAAVAASRLQGALVTGSPMAARVLCISGSDRPEAPGEPAGLHQHCALCAFVAFGCGTILAAEPLRFAVRDAHFGNRMDAIGRVRIASFEARAPPQQA